MKTKMFSTAIVAVALALFASCGGEQANRPFEKLVDLYVKVVDLRAEMEEKFKEANETGNADEVKALLAEIDNVEKETEGVAESLVGKPFPCAASEKTGVTLSEGTIGGCKGGRVANIVIKARPSEVPTGVLYFYLLDDDDNIVHKSIGFASDDGLLNFSFQIATQGLRSLVARDDVAKYGTITKLLMVAKDEYEQDIVPEANNTQPAEADNTKPAVAPEKITLNDKGIGDVTLGMDIKKLPKTMAGVYDKVVVKEEYNAMEDETSTDAVFTLKGKEVMTAMSFNDGTISYICVSSPQIGVVIGGKEYKVGMPISEVLNAPGVKKDPDGNYAALYGDIKFDVDANNNVYSIVVGSAW